MAFDETEIRSLAALAHLSLSEEELQQAAGDLDRLLGYIARISSVDVSEAIEMTAGLDAASGESLALRPDVARPGLPREVVIASAPSAPLGLFEVPRVVIRSGAGAAPGADDEMAP